MSGFGGPDAGISENDTTLQAPCTEQIPVLGFFNIYLHLFVSCQAQTGMTRFFMFGGILQVTSCILKVKTSLESMEMHQLETSLLMKKYGELILKSQDMVNLLRILLICVLLYSQQILCLQMKNFSFTLKLKLVYFNR